MKDLFRQRDELLEKIRKVAQTYESSDNAINANQIVELNAAQAGLLVQKNALANTISALNAEYHACDEKIVEFFSDDVQKILRAIQNQRWFFFSNNDKILLDRDTALLWANLDHFPYSKDDKPYSNLNSYAEVKDLLAQKNSERWGGYDDWKIPTPHELWHMIEGESFPFQSGSNWQIKCYYYWCVDNGSLACKDLDDRGATTDIADNRSVYVLPCSHVLVPPNFSGRPQELIALFAQNNLTPKFKDTEINELYEKIFGNKTALIEIEKQIAALRVAPIKLTAKFNYRQVLAKFDTVAVDKSPIKYFDAVLSLTDEWLDILSRYEKEQSETIAEYLKIALNLNKSYIDNPNLTLEENSLFAERQKFLATRLDLRIDEPKKKILSVKAQAEEFFALLDKINCSPNSIRLLAKVQAEPRADFELLVENLAQIILDTQRRVNFFAEHKDVISIIVKEHRAWENDYLIFKTNKREELTKDCLATKIYRKIPAAWYKDWQTKRFALEQRFLPLAEFVLKGNLSDETERVLKILREYRDAVDKFYLHERKNIYMQISNAKGSNEQERLEVEIQLYKLTEKFQNNLLKIIFAGNDTEERIFLLRWAEPLLDLPLDALSKFISDHKLDAMVEKILNQFAELRKQNYEKFLADNKALDEAIKQKNAKTTELIFAMSQALKQH